MGPLQCSLRSKVHWYKNATFIYYDADMLIVMVMVTMTMMRSMTDEDDDPPTGAATKKHCNPPAGPEMQQPGPKT